MVDQDKQANNADDGRLAALADAFASFSSVSSHLEASYRDLQSQVEQLQKQLASARRDRADEARRLTAVLEAVPGGVIMVDDSGVIRRINNAASDLLGDPLQDSEWQSVCRRAFFSQTNDRGDLTLCDGRLVSVAQKDMNPEPGRVLLLTDVTENRKFQELLDRHRRLAAMGEMAAALAHQIRTPLSAALLYTTNASRPELAADKKQDLLDKATTCLTDLEQLIGDMLQFARGASHENIAFSLTDVLNAVDRSLRPALGPRQSLSITAAESPLQLSGNREAVIGAVLNLANNALQAAGDSARVQIDALTSGAFITIRVADNGPGISESQAEKIFDPFYTSRPDGTGLGLAVVRSVAESHGGSIDVHCHGHSNGGAVFELRLPLSVAVESSTSASLNQITHHLNTEDAAA